MHDKNSFLSETERGTIKQLKKGLSRQSGSRPPGLSETMMTDSTERLIVVAEDGSGDFSSLQAAVDSIPGTADGETRILLRAGEYREKVVIHRDRVRLTGEDRDRTVLTWNGCAKDLYADGTEKGTFLSSTLMITGDDVTVENLTVRNDAGDGRDVGQAVAVYAAGDRGIWRNCTLDAHQDTLFCGPVRLPNVKDDIGDRHGRAEAFLRVEDGPLTRSRQYFEHCTIRGDVDFIFGPYRCWFEAAGLPAPAVKGKGTWDVPGGNMPGPSSWNAIWTRMWRRRVLLTGMKIGLLQTGAGNGARPATGRTSAPGIRPRNG